MKDLKKKLANKDLLIKLQLDRMSKLEQKNIKLKEKGNKAKEDNKKIKTKLKQAMTKLKKAKYRGYEPSRDKIQGDY